MTFLLHMKKKSLESWPLQKWWKNWPDDTFLWEKPFSTLHPKRKTWSPLCQGQDCDKPYGVSVGIRKMFPFLQADATPHQAHVLVNRTQAPLQPLCPLSQTPLKSEKASSFITTWLNALLKNLLMVCFCSQDKIHIPFCSPNLTLLSFWNWLGKCETF